MARAGPVVWGVLVALLGLSVLVIVWASTGAPDSSEAPVAEGPADLDRVDRSGFTPLMRAASADDVDAVRSLQVDGASPNATGAGGMGPVHVAAEADAVASLDVLLAAGGDPTVPSRSGMDALHHAAATGSVAAIELLAPEFPELDHRSTAVTQGHGYPRDTGASALGLAAWNNRPEAVAILLRLGATVDHASTSGNTPLLLAVYRGADPSLVRTLLDAGADPAAVGTCHLGCSEPPATAAEWAARLGRDDLVSLLDTGAPATACCDR